ncbi:sulfurtransferase [Aeromicrobium alkaliterrae]|uniref:Sulfurtransferase n=1 Tax=Aeromicrobium alkaliterrae TaxID=302168 RepID=A0ABP4WBL3_9ACTN
MTILITPAELAAALESSRPPHVLDVRWALGGPPGHGEYLAGHVPGSVFVDLDTELATIDDPRDGRHPIPADGVLERAARRWGLHEGDTVVVHDAGGNLSAARAWWLLTDAGVADVRVLDGGLAAWTAAGLPLATDDVVPEPGTISLRPGQLPATDIDGAAAWPEHGTLLDVRAPERFRGETEPVDPRAGHVPGAVNVPTGGNVGEDGTFLAPDALRERFAAAGVEPGSEVAVYCGSGVTASHTVLALRLAGIDATLYPGSWSQWSQHPDRPVATGS